MLYSGVYKALIISSVVSFLISIFSEGKTSYNSLISGYSSLTLGLMMILTIVITKIMEVNSGSTTKELLLTILMSLGPFLLMMSIIGFILYLIIVYKDPILDNHVSKSYHTFSNITIVLLLIQIFIVYSKILDTKEFEESGKISKILSSLLYLLGVLSLYSTMIIYIILKYFITDGFQGLKY
jgi:lysylphosphatidylglycerol synthetase-like protein (DUF2156 family)